MQPRIILGGLPTQDYHGFVINRQLEDVSSRSQKKRATIFFVVFTGHETKQQWPTMIKLFILFQQVKHRYLMEKKKETHVRLQTHIVPNINITHQMNILVNKWSLTKKFSKL